MTDADIEALAEVIAEIEEKTVSAYFRYHGGDSEVTIHEVDINCGSAAEIVEGLRRIGWAITRVDMPIRTDKLVLRP